MGLGHLLWAPGCPRTEGVLSSLEGRASLRGFCQLRVRVGFLGVGKWPIGGPGPSISSCQMFTAPSLSRGTRSLHPSSISPLVIIIITQCRTRRPLTYNCKSNKRPEVPALELHILRMIQCFLLKCRRPQAEVTPEAVISCVHLSMNSLIGLLKNQLGGNRFG